MKRSIWNYKQLHSNWPVVLEIEAKYHMRSLLVMKRYLRVRGSTPGLLFIFADHTSISASYFARKLATCFSHCGYEITKYTGHSFCIGAATTAAERGFTDVQTSPSHPACPPWHAQPVLSVRWIGSIMWIVITLQYFFDIRSFVSSYLHKCEL